jgi:hypothetical protein
MADLAISQDLDDPIVSAVGVAIMAQADDILLVSLLAAGLQRKLNELAVWCSRNFIVINLIRTIILIFGPVPRGANVLNVTKHEKYVGVYFRSDKPNIFEDHYKEKARTARY